MTHLRLSTFFEAYDNQDASAMKTWAQECLQSQPQMLVEVFCACVEDSDESVAVDFMLNQMSHDDQWGLAVHLFKGHKSGYFDYLLPKLSDEHSYFSFSCVDYILTEAVNTQNIGLLNSVIPHLIKSSTCDWEEVYTSQEVNSAWEIAMDKAVEKGWFDVVKTLLPHTLEETRIIPALTAVEWQRKDHLEHIFEHSSANFSVTIALQSIRMNKCRKMARYILNTYPHIVSNETFLSAIQIWEDDAPRQWVDKYLAQKQRTKISAALRKTSSSPTVSRKM